VIPLSAKSKLLEHLTETLPVGETVVVTSPCQVKGGAKKRLGRNVAQGVAAGLAVTATGGAGLLVMSVPPAAWLMVTSQRVQVIERPGGGRKLGVLMFDAPLELLTASRKRRVLNQVTISDAEDGESLLRLNLGFLTKRAKHVAATVTPNATSRDSS
jgi:hypothetical protein